MEKKIDGTLVSKVLYDELVTYLEEKSERPHIKIISVGDDFGSQMYGKMKKKKLTEIAGYTVDAEHYDDLSIEELEEVVRKANFDEMIDGIIACEAFCDLELSEDGTRVVSFTALELPDFMKETQEPSAQDDTDAMLIDIEYRLTLLELGITE